MEKRNTPLQHQSSAEEKSGPRVMSSPNKKMLEGYPPLLGYGRGQRVRAPPGQAPVRHIRGGTGRSRTSEAPEATYRPTLSRQDAMSANGPPPIRTAPRGENNPGTSRDYSGGARPKSATKSHQVVTQTWHRSSSEAAKNYKNWNNSEYDRQGERTSNRQEGRLHSRLINTSTDLHTAVRGRSGAPDPELEEEDYGVRPKRTRQTPDPVRSQSMRHASPYRVPIRARTPTPPRRSTPRRGHDARKSYIPNNELPSNRDVRFYGSTAKRTPPPDALQFAPMERSEAAAPQSRAYSNLLTANNRSREHIKGVTRVLWEEMSDKSHSGGRTLKTVAPCLEHVRESGGPPLTVGMKTATSPGSRITQGTAEPQPYSSIAGLYRDFEHSFLDPLPCMHQQTENVSAAGTTIEDVVWRGSVNPLRGGFEVQMVGTMPISGIIRGPHGENIYGCQALGCTVTRLHEGNVYGHWITKHCYSANVFWCDSRGCDQYYLKKENAESHRQNAHPMETFRNDVGTGKLVQMEGETVVTLWKMNARFDLAPSQTRDELARMVRSFGGIMESRLAAQLRRAGLHVPLDRVCPPQRPEGDGDDDSVISAGSSLWQTHVASSHHGEPSSAAGAAPADTQEWPPLVTTRTTHPVEEAASGPSMPIALTLPPPAVVALKPPEVSTSVTTELPEDFPMRNQEDEEAVTAVLEEPATTTVSLTAMGLPSVQIVYLPPAIEQPQTLEPIIVQPDDVTALDQAPEEDLDAFQPAADREDLVIQMEVSQEEERSLFLLPGEDEVIELSSTAESDTVVDHAADPSRRTNVLEVNPTQRSSDIHDEPEMDMQEEDDSDRKSDTTLPPPEGVYDTLNDSRTESPFASFQEDAQANLDLFVGAADRGYQEGATGMDVMLDYGYGHDHIRDMEENGDSYRDVRVATVEPRWEPLTHLNQVLETYQNMVPVSFQVHPAGPRFWVDQDSAENYSSRMNEFRLPLIAYISQALEMLGDTAAWENPMISLQPALAQQRALRDTHNTIGTVLQAMDPALARAALLATEHQEEAYRARLEETNDERDRAVADKETAKLALQQHLSKK